MDAERTLIIMLSIVLIGVLLVVALLVFQLIKVTRTVRSIASKADLAANNLLSVSAVVKKAAAPLAVSGVAGSIIEKLMGMRKSAKKGAKK